MTRRGFVRYSMGRSRLIVLELGQNGDGVSVVVHDEIDERSVILMIMGAEVECQNFCLRSPLRSRLVAIRCVEVPRTVASDSTLYDLRLRENRS